MNVVTPTLAKAFDIATAFVQQELSVRKRLDPHGFAAEDVWASVTHSGRIFVGTPLLRSGQGYHVNQAGKFEEV